MQLTGDKWVIVYASPAGRREALVKAGCKAIPSTVASECGRTFVQVVYCWDGSTRDSQGRRVYA